MKKLFVHTKEPTVGINPTKSAQGAKKEGNPMKKLMILVVVLILLALGANTVLAEGAGLVPVTLPSGAVFYGTPEQVAQLLATLDLQQQATQTYDGPGWIVNLSDAERITWGQYFQIENQNPHFVWLNDGLTVVEENGLKVARTPVKAGQVLKISGSFVEVFLNGQKLGETLQGGDPSRNTLFFMTIPADGELMLVFSKGWVPSIQLFDAGVKPYAWAEYRDLGIQVLLPVEHLKNKPYDGLDVRILANDGTYDFVIVKMGDTVALNPIR